ncbi:PREDICTED: interleukin-36 receptor antagonist protein-like isoform X2 [Lepidothrix coronata]|uniref:Interleukin-1 n=1 Tax=Lepidothrix coronata TaxID=321398 RepID=A0A6J0IKS9_9PASS|nr:PREDICTED: interleukin-36 receptor antagonist protein-like isoform X2 [Lepidothrix coronata]
MFHLGCHPPEVPSAGQGRAPPPSPAVWQHHRHPPSFLPSSLSRSRSMSRVGGSAEAEGFSPCQAPTLQTKVFQYRLWDVNQKSLYLRDDQLLAGHLQGANAALEEKVFWVPNRAFEPTRLPVILGIRNGTRCLASPPKNSTTPALQLQAVDIRELPHTGEASAAFTFFRSYKDGLWRFESAANPGWFLCTSARGHQPLALSRSHDATHLLDFYFQLC